MNDFKHNNKKKLEHLQDSIIKETHNLWFPDTNNPHFVYQETNSCYNMAIHTSTYYSNFDFIDNNDYNVSHNCTKVDMILEPFQKVIIQRWFHAYIKKNV